MNIESMYTELIKSWPGPPLSPDDRQHTSGDEGFLKAIDGFHCRCRRCKTIRALRWFAVPRLTRETAEKAGKDIRVIVEAAQLPAINPLTGKLNLDRSNQ